MPEPLIANSEASPRKVKKAKPDRARIHAVVRRLVDPKTGEEVAAFVPVSGIDRHILKERKCATNSVWRLELSRRRNAKFHRLAHGLGRLVSEQIEAFAGLDGHKSLKRLQVESGTCCELMEIDLGVLGKHMVKQAQSLSFDSMSEDQFAIFWQGVVRHLCATYWAGMSPDEVERQAELIGDMP